MHLKKCRSSYTPYDHPVAPDFCSFSFLRTCSVSLICGLTAFIHFPRISVAPWPEEPGREWQPPVVEARRKIGNVVGIFVVKHTCIYAGPPSASSEKVLRKSCRQGGGGGGDKLKRFCPENFFSVDDLDDSVDLFFSWPPSPLINFLKGRDFQPAV
jgi:hypothetical protein